MANVDEDVIELGSSDEETEPAPKKRKPMPAMVHIPNKLPGVTIKPANQSKVIPAQKVNLNPALKQKINPLSIANASIGKGVTVTKVNKGNKVANPFANNNKLNGKTTVRKQFIQASNPMPIVGPAISIRPTIKKIQQLPIKLGKGIVTAPSLLRPLASGILPPGITVKRTSALQVPMKPLRILNPTKVPINSTKKTVCPPVPKKSKMGEMVCVNLDDDEVAPSQGGPQWYLRPEEQEAKPDNKLENISTDLVEKTSGTTEETETTAGEEETTDLEMQNNKEPDTTNYIEITIDDSPAKPQIKSKRTCEVTELAITIDDSPVKSLADKPSQESGSDEENTPSKEKHSKKKLEYTKTDKRPEAIEIEIELPPVESQSQYNAELEIVEIEESPIKPAEHIHTSTPKKKHLLKPQIKMNDGKSLHNPKPQLKLNDQAIATSSSAGEFHPVYQSFINLCFQLENTEDMRKIVEKKIKSYYRQVPKEYTESEMFIDMVSSKINSMKADPVKMYLFIKDVVDELNLQRKIAKSQPAKLDTVKEEQDKFLYGEESEFDSKRQRQIRKLEKTLKKLHRAIQKLEEQEVDFDDEDDSVYLLTESEQDTSMDIDQPFEKSELLKRYKERMIRVHAKFCQLTNTKMPSEPRVQIDARPGQHKGAAKRLEKWINKKVPIGTPLPFPDFHDVLRCVREANQEDKLGWNEADIMEEARDLFTRCGRKLQRRRQENEWRLAASRIQSELDPAEESEDLKKKLEDNRRVASKKETEVFNKFADRQNLLKLEGIEIGDIEAEESPVESDDEEPTEESTSLETKEKRKERLKRLLQEKSKKVPEGKEPINETQSKKEAEGKLTSNATETKKDAEGKGPSNETESKKEAEINELSNETESKKEPEVKTPSNGTEKPDNNDVKAREVCEEKREDSNDNNSQIETEKNEKDPIIDKHNDNAHLESKNKRESESEKVHSLSDESYKIDSDIDELHLLQKLHSDVVDTSTLESSDSESPIAISDDLSSNDNKKQASDVISIENSSYSESEKNNEQEYELVSYSQKKSVTESVVFQMEIECSEAGIEKKIIQSNNDEYNESVEDILLASSDDEANDDSEKIKADENNHKTTGDVESFKENIKDQSEKTSDKTDDIKSKEINENEKNVDNSEVTSITSADTGDDELVSNIVEVTSINSVETVEDDTNSNSNDNAAEVTSIKSVETLEDDIITSPFEEPSKMGEEKNNKTLCEDIKESTDPVKGKTATSLDDEHANKINSDKTKEDEINSGPEKLETNSDESKDGNKVRSVENIVTQELMDVDGDIDKI